MAEVATEPTTEQPEKIEESPSKSALLDRLDELLKRYLYTLDQYQKARTALSTHLSSGFISLAQANFSNTSRTRYGQDFYDDRMQATSRISLASEDHDVSFRLLTGRRDVPSDSAPSPLADPSDKASDASLPAAESTSPSEPSTVQDPLRWFGILVPPALRSAQSSFASAIQEPVPQLASLSKELRSQEIDIARLRKQIRRL